MKSIITLVFKTITTPIHAICRNAFFSNHRLPVGIVLLLSIITATSFGQCQDVTQATWARNTTSSSNVYYDAAGGGITRIGNSTTHARIADGTTITYDVAIYQTATIIPTASAQGTVNLPVGQQQTISVVYQAPQSNQAGNEWIIGWASTTAFVGATGVGTNANSGSWAAYLAFSTDASGNTILTLKNNNVGIGAVGATTVLSSTAGNPLLANGDSISITLIPRTGGTTDLQMIAYRPSTGAVLAQYTAQNVLLGTGSGPGLSKLYPTVQVMLGAANMGCIKVLNQSVTTPTLPNSGTCGTGVSSPWQVNTTSGTYTIANDGTQTRLAAKSGGGRAGANAPGDYLEATVNQNAVYIASGDTSVMAVTLLAIASGGTQQRYVQGWAYSPTFNGGGQVNGETSTVNTARWATNIYIQGNSLWYYDDGGNTYDVYDNLLAGDQIIGKLIPATSGTGADLQIYVYRSSSSAIVFGIYIKNVLTTSLEASHAIYAAVSIGYGETNIGCIGAGIGSLPSVGGTASSNQSVCSEGTPASNLTVTGITGSVTKWQYSSDNFASDVHDIASSASSTLTTAQMGALSATRYYRAVVQNGSSPTANSSIVTITVNVSVGGTASSNQAVCTGSVPSSNLTLSGNTGSVTKWQYSIDNFSSDVHDIASSNSTTLTTAQIGSLTTTTYYRAVVQNSTCTVANSSIAILTVNALSVGGTASSNQTICAGSPPLSNLTLSGNTGSVTKWQYSIDNFSSDVHDIASSASSTLTTGQIGSLSATTYYRAVVQSGVCASANSSVVTITVNATSVGGTPASTQTICSGTAPADLILSGNTGSVTKWQYSSDNFSSDVHDIASSASTTLSSATMGNITSNTYYRAVVQSGVCASANSSSVLITVNPVSVGGIVSSSQSICTGNIPSSLVLSGSVGSVVKWQYSNDNFSTDVHDIPASGVTTLLSATIGALTGSTYYRAVVQSGVCATSNSSVALITVSPTTVAGTPSSSQSICTGSSPADLTLSGNTGSVTKWQYSSDNFSSDVHDIASSASTTLLSATMGALTVNRYYRAVVQSGTCASANSSSVLMTINAKSVGGTAASAQKISAGGSPANLTLSGNTGSVTKWQYSSDNFLTDSNDIASTASTTLLSATMGTLSNNRYYRAVVQSGVCTAANSSIVMITAVTIGGTKPTDDFDGDGILNNVDIDKDNDGVLDVTEGLAYAAINGTASNYAALKTTSFNATFGTCSVNYSTVNPIPGQIAYSSTAPSGGLSFANILTADLGTSATTITPILTGSVSYPNTASTISQLIATVTPGSLQEYNIYFSDPEYTSITVTVLNSNGDSLSTLDWSAKTYTTAGVSPAAVLPAATVYAKSIRTHAATSGSNYDAYRIRIGETTLATAQKIIISMDRAGASSSAGDGVFFGAVGICKKDTDGDGKPDWYDLDADGDGCSDAYEAGATTSKTTNYQFSGTDANSNGLVDAVENGTSGAINYASTYTCYAQNASINLCSGNGTVSSAQTICYNSSPANLTVSGYAGTIVKWQYSSDAFASDVHDIASTSATLSSATMGALTANRSYRVVLLNGSCNSYSDTVLITINASSVGGTVSSDQTICKGSNPADLTVTGNTGNVVKWQYSNDNFSSDVHDIASSASTTLLSATMGALTSNRYYRAVVQNGVCASANSSVILVTVNTTSVGGTIASAQTICSGSSPSDLTLSGNTGSVVKWQYSSDNFSSDVHDISNATATLSGVSIGALTANTYYRAIVQNGVCTAVNSDTVLITVNTVSAGGTVSSDQTICGGTSPADLTLSGYTGSVVKWQYSEDNFNNDVHDIASSASATLSSAQMGTITINRYYRAVVQNGVCAPAYSSTATVAISVSGGGFTPASQSICPNTSPVDITLSGNIGTVVKWQYSVDSFESDIHDIASSASATLTASQIGVLNTSTYYRAIIQNGGCSEINSPVTLVGIINHYTWTGATSTDWNTASNWTCNVVPKLSTDVTIPSGLTHYPIVNTTPSGLIHDLAIDSGASVTISSGDTLKISGAITKHDSASLDARVGTIELKGGIAPQTIAGSMFVAHTINTLVISDSVATISNTEADTLKIVEVLSFGKINNATLHTGDNIALLSDCSAVTARVADLTNNGANSGNAIIGKATVQRCIPGHRSWRLLTAPVSASNTIYNSWQNGGVYTVGVGTLITMPSPVRNGLDAGINANYSMNVFNPATQAFVAVSNTQVAVSPGSAGSADNMGYMIFVRGDRNPLTVANPNFVTPPTHNTVLCSFGNLQTYDQTFAGQTTTGKYTVVGNPYASPVDFNNVSLHNTIKRFYTWDPNINSVGGFVVLDDIDNDGQFDKSVGGSAQTQLLQSGQAFMIQSVANGASSVTFNETTKSIGDNILVFRPASVSPSINLDLYLLNTGNTTTYADGALVQYNNAYSASVDWQDAPKLGNMNEGIGLLREAKTLSIERRPVVATTDTLFLKLTGTTARNYQFKLTPASLLKPGLTAVFVDNYLNTSTALDLSGTNTVNFSVTSATASAATNRFMIVFNASTVLPVTFTSAGAVRKDAAALVNWKVSNEVNVAQYKIERSTNGGNFTIAGTVKATGNNNYQWIDSTVTNSNMFYRIIALDNDGSSTYSNTVKVDAIQTAGTINLPNNNYNGDMLRFAFVNMPAGNYTARLLTTGGQLLGESAIKYNGGTTDVPVKFGLPVSQGINLVEIVCIDGTSKFFKVNTYK